MSPPKLPPFGKALVDRLAFGNAPFLTIICVGGDAWQRAKSWNAKQDTAALVLTPEQPPSALFWPVKGCLVIVEWAQCVQASLIAELVKCLIKAGAISATVRPLWVDFQQPTGYYTKTDGGLVWVQEQPTMRTFRARSVSHES